MQEADDLGAEGIEFAGATGALPRMIMSAHRPLGYGALVQSEQARRLRDGKSVAITALTNLLERFVVDHAAPPSAWRKMSATERTGPSEPRSAEAVDLWTMPST